MSGQGPTPRAPRGFVLLAVLLALMALTAAFAFRLYPSFRGGVIAADDVAPSSVDRALARRIFRECVKSLPAIVTGPVAERGVRRFAAPMGAYGEHRCEFIILDAPSPGEGQLSSFGAGRMFVDVEAVILGGLEIPEPTSDAESFERHRVRVRAAAEVELSLVDADGVLSAAVVKALPRFE